MKRVSWILLLASSTLLAAQQAAQPPGAATPHGTPTRQESTKVVVPAETTIPLELRSTINSRTAYVGQAVYCETIYPITVGNRIVIPVGSYVKGRVTEVSRPGRVKGKAQLGIRFDSLTLANGTTRPLRATLSSYGGTGNEGFDQNESKIKGAASKGEDAGKVAQTTVTGAEVGTIAGASTGHLGRGLGIGSAAGAAGGLVWVLASRGKEIVLPAGTNLELRLSAPLSYDRDELDPPSDYRNGPAIPRRDPGPSL